MKKNSIKTLFSILIVGFFLILALGSEDSKEKNKFNLDMKCYSDVLKNTSIQFTENGELWIAQSKGGLSGVTDGKWEWVSKDSLTIKITMAAGVNSDRSGIYQFRGDCLFPYKYCEYSIGYCSSE